MQKTRSSVFRSWDRSVLSYTSYVLVIYWLPRHWKMSDIYQADITSLQETGKDNGLATLIIHTG